MVYGISPLGIAVDCDQSPIGGNSNRVVIFKAHIAKPSSGYLQQAISSVEQWCGRLEYSRREDLKRMLCISNFIL